MQECYKNPLELKNEFDRNRNQCGDPFIMRFDGWYYLYCSSHGREVKCWKSEDLVNFNYVGCVCSLPEIDGAYAPEVCYTHGKFYMITSPKGSGHYLLEASSPAGQFELVSENFGLLIDGSFFIDDDGKEYLLRAGHDGIVIHDMKKPNFPVISGSTIPQSWLKHWTEGPMLIKRGNRYFLTYTGNHLLSRGYRIAFSVSETSPKHGYTNLRNNTLLLEVGEEFHALGHSSSVLGPDMDSYFIAYHSFDFRADKPFRSLNIDRLFFNEARMYTNATWWEQPMPQLPEFYCRNGEKLVNAELLGKQFLITPEIKGIFTAEFNINPKNKSVIIIAGIGSCTLLIFSVTVDGHYELSKNTNVGESTILLKDNLPINVSLNANLSIRMAYTKGNLFRVWLNGMFMGELVTALNFGALGIWSEACEKPGFVGYSFISEGEGDFTAVKSVPGRFDAIHTVSKDYQVESFLEHGLKINGVRCNKATELTYNINVKEKSLYTVLMRVSNIIDTCTININSVGLMGESCCALDSDGFEIINMGTIELEAGIQTLLIDSITQEAFIDYFEIVPYKKVTNMILIKNGQRVYGPLQIMGHKNMQSMLHKYSGFTCAENHGMAYAGESGWTDYSIHAVMNIDPATNGNCSIFLRVTKESWFHAQVAASLFAYRIKVNSDGISLSRCFYDELELASYRLSHSVPTKVTLDIMIRGGEINILIDQKQKLVYIDPEQFGYGKIGIESMWEGYGFETLEVKNLG